MEAFAEIWGTSDLIVSFDGMNVTLPVNEESGRVDITPNTPWPRKSYLARSSNHVPAGYPRAYTAKLPYHL